MPLRYLYCFFLNLCLTIAFNTAVRANTVIQDIQNANPNERILIFLNHLDSFGFIPQNEELLSSFFKDVQDLSIKINDERLHDYVSFYKKAEVLITEKDTTGRIADFNNLLEEEINNEKPIFIATCRFYIGQNLFDQGNYTHGFENMLMAQELFAKIGYQNVPEIGKYLHYLSLDYYSFAYYDKAIEILQSSAKYTPYSTNLDMQIYNTIGMCYKKQALWDSAAPYFKIAIAKAKQYNDSTWLGIASGNLGRVYLENDRYQEAIEPLLQEYKYCLKNSPLDVFTACLDLSNAYTSIGDAAKAKYYMLESKQFLKDKAWYFNTTISDRERLKAKYYSSSSKYYKSTGNIQLAYTFLDSFTMLNKTFAEDYNANQLKLVEKKLEIQKYQLSSELEAKEKKITTIRNWLLNICLLLIAVLFGAAFWVSKTKRNKQLEIEVEKNRVAALEERVLQQKLLQSQNELIGYIQRLNDKNELLEKVASQLSVIQKEASEGEKLPKITTTIQNLTDASLLTNADWEEFKEKFSSVYPLFFDRIIAKYPDLTASELRLIALSKLDMDTKQMGMMLGISAESIRKSKYRIRKKLNLDGDADLGMI